MKHLRVLVVLVGAAAVLVWVRTGRAAPAQPQSFKTVEVTLPAAYGELRGVDRGALYFENVDGTIHVVHLNLAGEVDQDTIRIRRP